MIHIAIVEDKKNIRHALHQKLDALEDVRVVFAAENGKDFLEKMAEAYRTTMPDVVLMDIDMPLMNGIEAVMEGKNRYPNVKFLMLTIFDEEDKIFSAIKAGANGYLLKDEPIKKIKESMTDIIKDGGAPMSPIIARKTLNLLMNSKLEMADIEEKNKNQNHDYNLSIREKEVLDFITKGLEYKEIALQMDVSPNTVRNHISNVYKKLHVTSKVQAINVYNQIK
jgi:DNA-binding NarL/FixJ family response regulator